jgi:o-succinylbenzoate---CoA ligase
MTRGFYYDPNDPRIDWDGTDPVVLANPEWVGRADDVAFARANLPSLGGHLWVATSGTSADSPGRIRWVALSRTAFLRSAAAVNAHLSSTSSDVWAHALPVFHVGGVGILARASLSGASVVAGVAGRWDARAYRARVLEARATLSALVPSQIHDLVAAGLASPPSLRAVVIGGGRTDAGLYRAARALGWPCLPSYGLTETCSQVATATLESLASSGLPAAVPVLSHAEIRSGADGRLAIRASSLLTCYAEPAGDGMRAWDPKRDGWFDTDDLGRVTSGGVEVFGRSSDVVKVLGELVSLARVEEQLWHWARGQGLPDAAGFDLAVVALPHPRLGHELVAVLASTGPEDAAGESRRWDSLVAFSREALLPFERVRRLVRVGRIPRTPLGKCQRALLAREVGDQPGPDR